MVTQPGRILWSSPNSSKRRRPCEVSQVNDKCSNKCSNKVIVRSGYIRCENILLMLWSAPNQIAPGAAPARCANLNNCSL